ncbi:hypothetical protein BCCGELA001_24715 [Bradyrhizobium sp. CCGE-LA001]|nr:hypothetical protein BCCGELA001_24715 [Bradyrhizobium sp. CCGE-LA001]
MGAVDEAAFAPHPRCLSEMTRPLLVVARSSCDEAIQSVSAEGLWIASAFAKASADRSLRSQCGIRGELRRAT